MKVEINEKGKTKEKEFPKLMETEKGAIVLMINHEKGAKYFTGIVIKHPNYNTGEICEDWVFEYFQDFKGSITLSND